MFFFKFRLLSKTQEKKVLITMQKKLSAIVLASRILLFIFNSSFGVLT